MKKAFLVAVVIMTANVSFGQSFLNRFYFGLKAGGNFNNFVNADFGTESLLGYHGGAIVGFKITDKLLVHQEFLFSTQGAKIKDNLFGTKEDLKLSYLSVPILLKYHTSIGFYVEIGGQANMLIEDAKNTGFEDFADKVDAGAVAGLGYQFKTGPIKGLGLGARYYHGLMDVGKFDSSVLKTDFKNSVAQLSVFYIF